MINKPTSDFIATTFDVALAQGEDGAITAKIGTGLDIPATNSFLQVDYNSTEAVGDADGPETIFYGAYNSATGALTGVVRGQAGTTDVAHSAGAEVQCGMSTAFFEGDWKEIKGTFAYASATTITVASGAASIYSVGTKLRFQNNDSGTYLYAYVVTVADALLTVAGDTVPNATLTDAYFSNAASPVGFPGKFTYTPNTYKNDGTSGATETVNLAEFWMNGAAVKGVVNISGIEASGGTKIFFDLPVETTAVAQNRAIGAGYGGDAANRMAYAHISANATTKAAVYQYGEDTWDSANANSFNINFEYTV